MQERELEEEDYQRLMEFIMEAKDKGTHFRGQTFEDGMEAVIDVMEGNMSAKEACGIE
ncbi:MAG: hypothetical protein ACC642_10875 [Pseudomonadales bacterium]